MLQNIREKRERPGTYYFHIWESEHLKLFDVSDSYSFLLFLLFSWVPRFNIIFWRWGSTNDNDWLNKIYKSLDMIFISIKNMKWTICNVYQIILNAWNVFLKPRNQNRKPRNLFYFQVRAFPGTVNGLTLEAQLVTDRTNLGKADLGPTSQRRGNTIKINCNRLKTMAQLIHQLN